MATIVQRVRGVMNLLLVWALILFWVATVEPVNIHQLCAQLNADFTDLASAAGNGGEIPDFDSLLARSQGPQLSESEANLLQRLRNDCSCLYSLKYNSLSGLQGCEAATPATDFTVASRHALEIAQEGAAADHPGLASEASQQLIKSIDLRLTELEWHVERLDLGPTATLRDIAETARPRITIPGSGQSIPMAAGVAHSITGLACVYLYLVSLIRALRDATEEYESAFTGDWLFLHPGLLGPILGVVWLVLPLFALASAGAVVFGIQSVNSVSSVAPYAILVLLVAMPWSIVASFRTRWKLNRLAREAHAPIVPFEQKLPALADTGIELDTYRRAA